MKISTEYQDEPITEFKIRHKGADLNFAWTHTRACLYDFRSISKPNCCEIHIDDIWELEQVVGMLERVGMSMKKAIGSIE